MQLTDSSGNVYGVGGLEITTIDGKPKIPITPPAPFGNTVIVSSNYTALLTDYNIIVDGTSPITITIPSITLANTNGYNIKNIGLSTVTIVSLIGELIDDQPQINIKNAYTSLNIVPYINNWYIV
jgi:hypothetical protein